MNKKTRQVFIQYNRYFVVKPCVCNANINSSNGKQDKSRRRGGFRFILSQFFKSFSARFTFPADSNIDFNASIGSSLENDEQVNVDQNQQEEEPEAVEDAIQTSQEPEEVGQIAAVQNRCLALNHNHVQPQSNNALDILLSSDGGTINFSGDSSRYDGTIWLENKTNLNFGANYAGIDFVLPKRICSGTSGPQISIKGNCSMPENGILNCEKSGGIKIGQGSTFTISKGAVVKC